MQDSTHGYQRTANTHADRLNQQCYCVTLDRKALDKSLLTQLAGAGNEPSTVSELHHLFSNTPVFVPRGDKVTRRVFEHILNGGYIAQDLVPAGERTLRIDDAVATRKVDIRLYTYAGKSLLAAARIYQGQTTNFRTPGGGFAPVFQV